VYDQSVEAQRVDMDSLQQLLGPDEEDIARENVYLLASTSCSLVAFGWMDRWRLHDTCQDTVLASEGRDSSTNSVSWHV
jgi:hypothetical protein